MRALQETYRALRPGGGVLFAIVIPKWASALVVAIEGGTYDAAYTAIGGSGGHERRSPAPRVVAVGLHGRLFP
jgi:hypothetical protein